MLRTLALALITLLGVGTGVSVGSSVSVGYSVSVDGEPDPTTASATQRWDWPTGGARVILRPFTAPASRYGGGHRGIDIEASGPLVAPADGVVHFSGTVVDRAVLSITHTDGYLSSYEPVTTTLVRGDTVRRGQIIGEISAPGSTHCRSPCLHFGVRLHGEYLSPLMLLGAVPRSVLLPTRGGAPSGSSL
jgi:murein DD-endopeptidase MepM/ murein hydrolase activator NlpD